jgi:hypothetical protein
MFDIHFPLFAAEFLRILIAVCNISRTHITIVLVYIIVGIFKIGALHCILLSMSMHWVYRSGGLRS